MGWIDNKWIPRWPGDYCTGFFQLPEDGSAPIWELKTPNYEGTRENRPVWVMVNGREISHYDIAMKSGDSDCEVEPYGKQPPWGMKFAAYFCRNHVVWLADEDAVLLHFGGHKGHFGQWKKSMGIKNTAPEAPKPKIGVPEDVTADLRAFLEPIVAANEKFVGLWKQGKIGPLVGAAMREAKGKYEGKYVEAMLQEIVGV